MLYPEVFACARYSQPMGSYARRRFVRDRETASRCVR